MSRCRIEQIECPHCNRKSDFTIWESINTVIDPDMKEKARTGEIFSFECPCCGNKTLVQYATLYHQMEDKVMIYYVPGDPTEAIEMMHDIRRNEKGEPVKMNLHLDAIYHNRVVRTINQFREKLMILDAGLDDRVIELTKLFMLAIIQKNQSDVRIEEMLFDVHENGRQSFAVNTGNGHWGSVAFNMQMYNTVKKEFDTALIETHNDVVIDTDWAMDMLKR